MPEKRLIGHTPEPKTPKPDHKLAARSRLLETRLFNVGDFEVGEGKKIFRQH